MRLVRINSVRHERKTTNAQQPRGALDQIVFMEREDFLDQPLDSGTKGIESNEWIDWLYNDLDNVDVDVGANKDQEEPDEPLTKVNDTWYPFKNKMVISSGYISRTFWIAYHWITSRSVYYTIRAVLQSLFQLKIPAWTTICWAQAPSLGVKKLSEMCSQKRREDLPSNMRPQICINNQQHFYIFEPLETFQNQLYVPIFFYTFKHEPFAKFIQPQLQKINDAKFKNNYSKITLYTNQPLSTLCQQKMYEINENTQLYEEISLPNPWHIKADGKVIRHMYSDDTSGNISKQCNKHISFLFTLSGLPPNITNQEYNFHFLSTSNRADVLEIAGQILKESNEMTLNGFESYDITIGQPFLVISIMLLFLADSPMHAKITNTPIPGASLNPCRMFFTLQKKLDQLHDAAVEQVFFSVLHAPQQINKKSLSYLLQFLELGPNRSPEPSEDDITKLLNPFLKLQALMVARKHPWRYCIFFSLEAKRKEEASRIDGALPIIQHQLLEYLTFEAKLPDQPLTISGLQVPTYQSELKQNIQFFISHIIKFTTQWINKPQFQILLHLPCSILEFGPAFFYTGKRYCGIIFKLSVLELSIIWRCHMLDFFNKNLTIQKSIGYNPELSFPVKKYTFEKTLTSKLHELPILESLSLKFPTSKIHQISALQLYRHEEVNKSYFFLASLKYVGFVCSIWNAGGCFFVHVSKMEWQLNVDLFYIMRPFIKTSEVHFQDIKSTLNLQHDCHQGKCQVTKTRSTRIERLNTTIKMPEVQHQDETFFIRNSASLHAPEDHHILADLPHNILCPNKLPRPTLPTLLRIALLRHQQKHQTEKLLDFHKILMKFLTSNISFLMIDL
ncbi:hypothetical protein VP01_453g9 [Puccinia sorghi]|uniref:Uncharacterized protein n=1 Tax=Puccinia sorghi TaxID=27349 RepID=A0A0L6UPP0_9BASI|nr:hypothetical protein VP01_453g9 [Puccinia sorghi]